MEQEPSLPRRVAIAGRSIRDASGSSRIILGLTQGLADAGHKVDVYGENINPALIRRHGGTPRASLPFYLGARALRRRIDRRTLAQLATHRITRRGYDVVIGNGTLLAQTALIIHNAVRREAELLGDEAVAARDEAAELQEDVLSRQAFGLVIANSQLLADDLGERYGIAAERIVRVPPGIDVRQFSPPRDAAERTRLRARLGIAPGQLLLGFLTSGNFRLRGIDTLASAIATLPHSLRSKVRVLAVASARNAMIFHQALGAHGLDSQGVTMEKTAQIEDCYRTLDLLVHPARFETFGLVVAEAAACGCPVLTSKSVGAAELFTGEAAFGVVEAPEALPFAERLQALLADDERRATLAAAQMRCVRPRTWSVYAKEFWSALQAAGLT